MQRAVLTLLCLLVAVPAYAGSKKNIVETADSAGQFKTLLAAAKAAGLVSALSGKGPLTVFAPTDDAFGALPAGTVKSLLKPANKSKLAAILKFHVVSGRVGSGALADGATLETLAGAKLSFAATEKGFSVQGARIVKTDIGASNGVVHVIDRVMLPPEEMTRRQATMEIDRAIARGVPAFNHGNAAATDAIYTQTAEMLLASAALNHSERMRLQVGLDSRSHALGSRDSAWQMRYALDDVRDSLTR